MNETTLQPFQIEEIKNRCIPKAHQSAVDMDELVRIIESMLRKARKEGIDEGWERSEKGYG